MRNTPCFATRSEAVKARAELKAKIKQEYEATILAQSESRSSGKGLGTRA